MRTAVLALICVSCTLQPEDATDESLAIGTSSSLVSSHLFSGHWPLAADVDPGNAPASSPFPAYTMDVLRFWGMDAVQWGVLEPTRALFKFDNLDHAMAVARAHGVTQFEYTFGIVPHWANADAVDAACYRSGAGALFPASCVMPTDISDATTVCKAIPAEFRKLASLSPGNCKFQEFAFALVEHLNPDYNAANNIYTGTLAIHSWSPWNEINLAQFVDPPCKPTMTAGCSHIARIASDVRKIVKAVDPTAIVGTPAVSANADSPTSGPDAMQAYLSTPIDGATTGLLADVLIHHCYANDGLEPPEDTIELLSNFDALLTKDNDMAGKSRWCDEGSWAQNFSTGLNPNSHCDAPGACIDATSDTAREWIVRDHLIHIAMGTQQFNWYGGGAGWWGALATYDTPAGCLLGQCDLEVTSAERAREALIGWVTGAEVGTLTGPGGSTGSELSVTFTRHLAPTVASCYPEVNTPADYRAVITWDTAKPHFFDALAAGYTSYCLWDGSHRAATHADPVGLQPVLWERLK